MRQPPQVPDLAGLAEAAAILGVSKQRVRELAERDDTFPLPVAELSGGAIYLKSMIEEFAKRRNRQPGRPGSQQARVADELAHIPKDRGDLGQQILRMIYNSTRRHDLSVDPLTPRGQTLFRAIKLAREDNMAFEPRYDQSFFQLEPSDRRYVELHARCCPSIANETA